jgi:hypothetical protein
MSKPDAEPLRREILVVNGSISPSQEVQGFQSSDA